VNVGDGGIVLYLGRLVPRTLLLDLRRRHGEVVSSASKGVEAVTVTVHWGEGEQALN
jgi:precorrin-4 methylase